jgi:hypothetical protein
MLSYICGTELQTELLKNFRKDRPHALLLRREEPMRENKIMNTNVENKTSERVREAFSELREKPGKFARLILSKGHAVWIKNDGKKFNISEAIIAIRKGDKPMTISRFSCEKSETTMLGVVRNNKYIAYVTANPIDGQNEEFFETKKKDEISEHIVFTAILNTDSGTVFLVCDNRHEDFFYAECVNISTEPCLYGTLKELLLEALRSKTAEECENGEKE